MLRKRIIPALLLKNQSLVKTRCFNRFVYVGDPCNTVRIFNELEVDELLILDITATPENRNPNYQLLSDIASECFMPVAYGGGIQQFDQARKIFDIGIEKISINAHSFKDISLITRLSDYYGSQAIIASLDVNINVWGKRVVSNGKKYQSINPVEWAIQLEKAGAGEILITSINREGTWKGFDLPLVKSVASSVNIPILAHGGAGNLRHVKDVLAGGASAVAVGSMVVFQKEGMGVLVNFPEEEKLRLELGDQFYLH